ncbi:MAG: topoisomerase C-terminal repeat-containing protein [Lachnospiraceae bacterium]|nr:topoisomerase C-terminal repeat-containing protein [Lachnospiraceae bacterium]
MGKKLIITEKPSVAQDYAKVFQVSGRNNGYIENDKYVITWCVGHLVEMVYPEEYDMKYKKWMLEDLPFLPQNYKYGVIPNVKQQYDIVHGLLHREDIDTVYWAGDSGKEGQTIEENIRNFGGVREGMQELRVWIDSQTEEEIRRGVAEARPMSDYANLGFSGIMRSIEDYAMGINFSRVMSVKYGKLLNDAAATNSYTAIAIGRVMTCVLGMVVNREREIRNFKETPFYRIVGDLTEANIEAEWKAVEGSKYFESPRLYKENGFKEKEDALSLMQLLEGKEAVVKTLEKGVSKKKAPLLFNLAELQAECAKRFKISPDETLQVVQDLYEKKLTTYPRTDARVLTTAVAKEIGKNLNKLKGYVPTQAFAEKILQQRSYANLEKTQYTDDSKVTDHYAIIPTGQLTELQSLSPLQSKVFDLIVRRFLSIFYPPAEYQTLKLVVGIGEESLFTSAKVLKSLGFLEVMGKTLEDSEENEEQENEDQNNENANGENVNKKKDPKKLLAVAETLKQGDVLMVNGFEIKDGATKPPKRYTSGSMILAMENAGQLIEDEELRAQIKGSGIGTSATRAEIIKKLIRIGYLNLNKRTQVISPERFGEMVYEVVAMTVPALLNPKMTASWEKGLDGITNGTVDMKEYRAKLEDFIRKETIQIRDHDLTRQVAAQISAFTGKGGRGLGARKKLAAKCPMCGGDIVTTPFGYGCDNYQKDGTGCRFVLGTIAGRDLTEEECIALINQGRTEVLNGFVSKNKKKFQAALVMQKNDEGKIDISFDFSQNQPQILEGVQCPDCGGEIVKTPFGFGCSNYDAQNPESCRFSIGKIAGKEIGATQIKELLTNKVTSTIRGFEGKSGKKFDACLVLEQDANGKHRISFDFEHVESQKIKDVVCPDCGGEIVKTPFGYGCANFDSRNPESCRFSIGKIAGKEIAANQVKELLTDKISSTIRGFEGKSGKKFDACLVLKKDENGKHRISFDFDHVESKKIKDVVCPLCGGDIVKTPFGYGCANYDKNDEGSCRFSVGKMAGKDITEAQVKELLTNGRTSTIRGFKSKAGKKFDARIALSKDEEGKITGLKFDFEDLEQPKLKDVQCPLCGGDIVKTLFGYGCSNYNKDDESKSCRFSIGKISGVKLNDSQVKQLLTIKKTDVIKGFLSKSGTKFEAPLKLTAEGQIVFDFPEREKPVETNLMCPRCKERKLMKSQWYYECNFQCGFRIGHTVAQVPISEEIMQELFDTGKTKNKVVGFVSKAGNQFDTCLKFEDERIQFDFDNPGETSAAEATQNAQPWLAEDATLKEGQEQQVKVREETMKSFEDENVESLQEAPEPAADDYWASLMAGAADENAMNEEMDSMILSEQMLEDDGLPWN